ncbi:DUF4271 domain-containing protein [Mucilaginibacter sp.]|uniref:DUF4271 domain-containing protein n=1 Tax=Mucilaginibacter sp. TaxID=1882438 RepID=UPI002CC2F965|nr:DUF4271 domain-containing protein [Mucilaginibacter sp.]HTI59799.1 DUF4271 domain-containing protein [Mucilaginibacter sp.]
MRSVAACFLLMLFFTVNNYAQQASDTSKSVDTITRGAAQNQHLPFLDSVAQAMQQHDQLVQDSLATQYIRPADPARHDMLMDTLIQKYMYKGTNYLDIHTKSKSLLKEGSSRPSRDRWVIGIILALLIYAAILNLFMGKDVESVWQSFYSKRMLNQVSKDDGVINSWTFLALFLLFALTFGLFLYQFSAYRHVYYTIGGAQLFFSLTFIILVLFAVKFVVVKFLGFVFGTGKLVSEYLSVSYLTYFNIGFVFLPVSLCFSLLPDPLIKYVLFFAFVLIAAIVVWQYLRGSVGIISNILFHKFYLIVYLCALEICPILILIKALKI